MYCFRRTTQRSPCRARRAGLAVFCLVATLSGSSQGQVLLWYGGDAGSFSFIANTRPTADLGHSVLDDFIVSDPNGWHVTTLFSNNLSGYPIETQPFTEAAWSMRTGVSRENPGDILFAGTDPVTVTPTGRTFGGAAEYTVTVSGLSLDLATGVYFMNVTPVIQSGSHSVGASDGLNGVGSAGPSSVFQEERLFIDGVLTDTVFERAIPPQPASMGVIGTVAVPEPGTFAATGMIVVAGLVVYGWKHPKK